MDLDTRDFEYQMPAGQGSLRSPTQCEPDAETGDLYVVDSRRGDVVVFDSLYNYVGNFQVPGGRAGDVALQGDSVWVSDAVDAKILIFDKATRTLARSIPEYARGADQGLMEPNNLAVTEDRVFVSNWGKFNVQVYDHDGEYLNTIGGYGRNWGQFVRNKGIAADREGRVYVVDAAFNNVQMFSQEGELLLSFGGPYTGLGGMYLPADVTISYDPVLLQRFQEHVLEGRELEYLIFVTNQYGPDQVNVYGFLKTQRPAS
jgi:DNA-binding beta-propeller fold protein YncE